METTKSKTHIFDLPDAMIEQVLGYLKYDEIAKKRIISRRMNKICQGLLNRGFIKMTKLHQSKLKAIKGQLPRRESERRSHPLSRHSDILTCIETRISMLSMTYAKYMELDVCCFIPGKVIDEVYMILKRLDVTQKPLRAHEVLQELRDISSMAIEHFDDKIAHLLKRNITINYGKHLHGGIVGHGPAYQCSLNQEPSSVLVVEQETQNPTCNRANMNSVSIMKLRSNYNTLATRINQIHQVNNRQAKQNRQSNKQILKLSKFVRDLKRRLDESEVKNRELAANIIQLKTDAANKSPSVSNPKNMKPRSATIILKRRIEESENLKEMSKKAKVNDSV